MSRGWLFILGIAIACGVASDNPTVVIVTLAVALVLFTSWLAHAVREIRAMR